VDRHEAGDLARRAREAKMLMDHELLKGAFHDVREAMVESIENANYDKVTKDMLFCSIQSLKLVKEAIETHIETGKIIHYATEESNDAGQS
jgi:hypothetical protein